ncbi:MAG: hypothetical protein IH953_05020 [Chloroflexi bacterium]|nr:hypothetical protein [Chloroflexota bacterium]
MAEEGTAKIGRPERAAAEQGTAGERVRAWVLGKSDQPEETAKAIGQLMDDEMVKAPADRREDLIIVRADIVEGDYDLVVPVDAASEQALATALEMIEGAGLLQPTTLRVQTHNPSPPHAASTFVTAAELRAHPAQEFSPPGRHPGSPGRNAWG